LGEGSSVTLRELADRLDCRLDGDGAIEIARVAGIGEAGPDRVSKGGLQS
jgi:hypothetical protein